MLSLQLLEMFAGDAKLDLKAMLNAPQYAWVRLQCDRVFPGGADQRIASVAVYRDAPAVAGQIAANHRVQLVVHTPAGFSRAQGPPRTLDQMTQDLAGFVHSSGPELKDLPVIQLPERPSFSSAWFPPADVIIAHLRPYRLDLRPTPNGLRLQEEELPLAVLGLAACSTRIWLDLTQMQLMDKEHQNRVH